MNKKNIAKSLNAKLNDWVKNIDDQEIAKVIKENAIITGGALVSLLIGEEPNDYDIYFKTKESCEAVAKHYASKWNQTYPSKPRVKIQTGSKNALGEIINKDRITCFIRSVGIAKRRRRKLY